MGQAAGGDTVQPVSCLLQRPEGNDVGRVEYNHWYALEATKKKRASDALHPQANSLSGDAKSFGFKDSDVGVLTADEPVCPIQGPSSAECRRYQLQRHGVSAELLRTGAVLDQINIFSAMMEAILELGSQDPRPGLLADDWKFEYTSRAEDVKISLSVVEHLPPAAPEPDYRFAIEGFGAMLAWFVGGRRQPGILKEATFDIMLDHEWPVLQARVEKAV